MLPPSDWQSVVERRLDERREEDRARHKAIIALSGTLIVVLTLAISVGVAWGTSTAAMGQKVDKVEQIKVDAGFDARINVNAARIDGIRQALTQLQLSVDSANTRLRQIACDGKPASCR